MVQRHDLAGIGPSTFYGHIVESSDFFTVQDKSGVKHKTQANEMMIAVHAMLRLLSSSPRIAKPRPSPQHVPRRRGAPGEQQTRDAARNIAMVDAFIKDEG